MSSRAVRLHRVLRASPEKVYRAFTEGLALAKWLPPFGFTCTVHDLEAKVAKAMTMHGARYIHIFVPCPLGWGAASHDTIRLARLAHESGFFPVFEAERGEVTGVSKIRHQVPIEDYLRRQTVGAVREG